MKWVPLFVLTSLVTGLYNVYALLSVVNGAPIYVLNGMSLLGSTTLLGAAVLVPFRVRTAAKIGFFGSMLSWVFYAPLIVASVITPISTWRDIQLDISFREYVPLVGKLLGPILLIACTVSSIVLLRRSRAISQTVL